MLKLLSTDARTSRKKMYAKIEPHLVVRKSTARASQ
jgi:hypothetical protein